MMQSLSDLDPMRTFRVNYLTISFLDDRYSSWDVLSMYADGRVDEQSHVLIFKDEYSKDYEYALYGHIDNLSQIVTSETARRIGLLFSNVAFLLFKDIDDLITNTITEIGDRSMFFINNKYAINYNNG